MRKINISKFIRSICAQCLPICALTQLFAQDGAGLNIQLYPGLSVTGAVGTVYAVQYANDLGQTNTWRTITFVQPTKGYFWTDAPPSAGTQRFYRAVPFTGTNLVFIPPGTFRMGSPLSEVDRLVDEGPQTVVTLTKGFLMGKYNVTQGEYLAATGNNPSYFNTNNGYSLDLTRPVDRVSWYDATNYCGLLTRVEAAAGRLPEGAQYRLPTEAEFEYACRAWTSDRRLYYGDDPGYTQLDSYEWYDANSGGMTHPVGQKLPNAWGLYDMAGHASSWCQDWYGPYLGGNLVDPQGPLSGSERVNRGGSWSGGAENCRSAVRFHYTPDTKYRFGFRIVLAAAP